MADYKTLGAKVPEKDFNEFEMYANARNMTVSAVIKLIAKGVMDGVIQIEKGELVVNNEVNLEAEDTYFGQRVDRKMEKLRERGYPEKFIEMMKEGILNALDSQIDMLPKKYDVRRVKDDGGC